MTNPPGQPHTDPAMKKELPALVGSSYAPHSTLLETAPRVTRTDYVVLPDGSRVAVDFWTETRLIRVDAPRPLRNGEHFPLARGTPVRYGISNCRAHVARADYVEGAWLYEIKLAGRDGLTVSGVPVHKLTEVVNPGIAAI